MHSIELKIKAKSLAYEARSIRYEEERARRAGLGGTPYYNKLNLHRINVVRPEARATHLARAYIRGTPYAAVEGPQTRKAVDFTKVWSMVRRYHTGAEQKDLRLWLDPEGMKEVA